MLKQRLLLREREKIIELSNYNHMACNGKTESPQGVFSHADGNLHFTGFAAIVCRTAGRRCTEFLAQRLGKAAPAPDF